MSILDESFPNDEFLDKLDFTPNTDRYRYQFPYNRRKQLKQQQHQQQQQQQYQQLLQGEIKTTAQSIATTTATTSQSNNTNHSTSSSSSSSTSTSSLNDHHHNNVSSDDATSHKTTTKSEPNGSADNVSKNSHDLIQSQNRAVSYQDIHNEYTKRRYKHVESKVGQYIANMKAEDKKRRNSTKFQRHRSMPETLSDQSIMAAAEIAARHDEMHSSVAELNKLNESAGTSGADSSENMTGTSSSSRARHETSDEAGPTTDFINKRAYAQLLDEKERIQSHCDYLQTRLDEKISENVRLKRNVDFMRIELSNCKDKLQKQMSLGSYYNSSSCTLGRQSMHAYLCSQAKSSKATQTEFVTPIAPPPPPGILTRDLFIITPNTPDANNNMFESGGAGSSTAAAANGDVAMADFKSKSGKTMATIQPLSLNFSNLGESDSGEPQTNISGGSSARLLKPPPNNSQSQKNNSNTSHPSSGDSAIDIESASPQKLRPSSNSGRRQERREEFIYYDKRSGGETLNDPSNVYAENNKTGDVSSTELIFNGARNNKHSKKHNSLRRRWLRLFGPCTRCKDHNLTLDGAHIGADNNDDGSNRLEQAYTQIPLLEKSFLNHCRNLR